MTTTVRPHILGAWAMELLTTRYVDMEVVEMRTYDHSVEIDVIGDAAPMITTYRHEYDGPPDPGWGEVTVTSP